MDVAAIPQNRAVDELIARLQPLPGRRVEEDLQRVSRNLQDLVLRPAATARLLRLPEGDEGWSYAVRLLSEAPSYISIAVDVLAQSRMIYMLQQEADGS